MNSRTKTLLGGLSALVFILMTIAMLLIALIFSGQMWLPVLLALFFGGIAAFSGVIAVNSARQAGPSLSGLAQERSRILKLAAHQQGKLTAEEAAMECRIPIDQAQALLDDLVINGRADTWVSDGGSMVYVFRGLLEDDKATAEDPMKMLDP